MMKALEEENLKLEEELEGFKRKENDEKEKAQLKKLMELLDAEQRLETKVRIQKDLITQVERKLSQAESKVAALRSKSEISQVQDESSEPISSLSAVTQMDNREFVLKRKLETVSEFSIRRKYSTFNSIFKSLFCCFYKFCRLKTLLH